MKPLVYRKAKRVRMKAPVRQKLHITTRSRARAESRSAS